MPENIGIEKVMSHKQNQQQSIGGVWVVVEIVLHIREWKHKGSGQIKLLPEAHQH